jgi:hypothetical protein
MITKGKWEAIRLKSGKSAVSVNGKNHFISNGYGNARDEAVLFAAAPDLLEACEVALLAVTHNPVNPADVAFIQTAIAKATI